MTATCPRCGWESRALNEEEVQWIKEGRLRCSGKCQEGAVPGSPTSFPPKLKLKGEEEHGSH